MGIALVDLERSLQLAPELPVAIAKSKGLDAAASRGEVTHDVVGIPRDVIGMRGYAPAGEVVGCRTHRPRHIGDLPRDEVRVVRRAADRAVDPLAGQVDRAVGDAKLHVDSRIPGAERG